MGKEGACAVQETGRYQLSGSRDRLGHLGIPRGVEPLQKGLSLGACLIDTAEIYGTEEIVGRVIEGRRHEVLLATNVSPISA